MSVQFLSPDTGARAGLPAIASRLRGLTRWRPMISTEALIVAVSLYFCLVSNGAFWQVAVPDPVAWSFAMSLFVIVLAVNALLLSALVWPLTARVLLVTLIPVAALAGHYTAAYGVYINVDMVRNVLATDWREATDLMGVDLLGPLLMALPAAVMVWRVRLKRRPWRQMVGIRLLFVMLVVVSGAAAALTSSQSLAALLRNHREVRYLVTPANFLVSLVKVIRQQAPSAMQARLAIGEDAHQTPPVDGRKPRLLVVVVGETARAANWGLSGYSRQTTPELAQRDVINFAHVSACGTSTEVSLPCMFSFFGRAHYDETAIRSHQSVLHVLQRAGIKVSWLDNQSGCKGVCDGLPVAKPKAVSDPELCPGKRCYDGVLLAGLDDAEGAAVGDQIMVLHMLGNHGPNYFERYPSRFRHYTPVCDTADLGSCSREQIINAYDNALLYTDSVLAEVIDHLTDMHNTDTALLYVSDHGESLGEKGVYLHGMPYAIAPDEQLQVPMVAWFSEGWRRSAGLDQQCLRDQAEQSYSHDNLVHTLLGLTEVDTAIYNPGADIFRPCRAGASAARGTQ